VTHNNLKITNILLDNNGNVKISDYMGWDIMEYITTGVDKGIDQEHSKDGVCRGKLGGEEGRGAGRWASGAGLLLPLGGERDRCWEGGGEEKMREEGRGRKKQSLGRM
jgi:hypothetical protein